MFREIEYAEGGLRLRGTPLWFDARRRAELAFVSHAHADHIGRHRRVVATAATLSLMHHRLGRPARGKAEALPAPYRRAFAVGDLVLELFPAGHVLGSAQIRVVGRGGVRICYTGDLCPFREPFTAEPAEIVPCDVLVVEATFGHPRYVFPPREEVLAQARAWVNGVLARGGTPVVMGYALGKSQEAMRWLGDAGYRVRVHPRVWAIARIYAEQGVAFPNCTVLEPEQEPRRGEVVVAPPGAEVRAPRARRAMLTGWALDGRAAYWGRADAAFPLSDHADFPTLLRYIAATGASRVYTVYGHAEDLARELGRRGFRADALRPSRQLELAL